MLREPLQKSSCLPWEDDFQVARAEGDLPTVSVVIPIFNSGAFLEKTLRSLLCNDMSGVELILMDGGSSDNTADIVAHYRDIFAVTVMEPDRGQSDAINKGFSHAGGKILYWLNGDDIILPNALTVARRAFRDNPGVHVIVGDAFMTEKDFTPIRHFVFSPEKLKLEVLLDYASNHLVQPSVFFSREAWDKCGPCKEDMHYAMDADLFLSMASNFDMVHLPADIAYSVYHEECKTRGKRAESITELALVQARHGGLQQARQTLDILVELFNEATRAAAEAPPPDVIASQKLAALEQEVSKNRELLLDLDVSAAP